MAIPQQPLQQPISLRDLSLALDRTYVKFASYTDARYDLLAAQMRIFGEESLIRDNDLANNMRALADTVLRLAERVGNIETALQEIRQEMREGFASQAERHNELMARVSKLERN